LEIKMRKIIKKLEQPNLIVDSLEKPKYASTDVSYTCDVRGPECNEEGVSEDDLWKSDWKDASDLPEHRNDHDAYDFHICPDCQKTNCMGCFHGVLEDSGRCDNKNCEYHDNCKECGEPYYQSNSGKAYCENKECSKYNSLGESTRAIENLKISTKNYWITCDGSPNCETDGWNPEYDRQPQGWHRREHHRYDESSTDYCEDCWDNCVCHECEEPYTDEELSPKFIGNDSQVCRNQQCRLENKCKHCDSEVDKFGNCKDKGLSEYGRTRYIRYCDNGTYCRHCENPRSRININRKCYDPDCEAYEQPTCDHAGCGKEIEPESITSLHNFCNEHKPLHCTTGGEDAPWDYRDEGCGGLLNPTSHLCPNCDPGQRWFDSWGLNKKSSKKEAHYMWEEDPNYPDEPFLLQHCDYPGCKEINNLDNPIVYEPMDVIETPDGGEKHYCHLHKDDEDICHICGEKTEKNYDDEFSHAYRHNPKCPVLNSCKECGNKYGKYGFCTHCENKTDEEYENNFMNAWGKK